MSSYKITYLEEVARNEIPLLPKTMAHRIKKAIEERLTTAPASYGKRLRYAHSGELRLRVGDYRIIYWIEEEKKEVVIACIKHRKDVYE
jgi:mRNA interferase RelE/StbE